MRPALLALLLAWPLAGAAGAADPEPPARPNIVLCIADDWSDPGPGIPGVPTPAFDRVAREGARFTRAFCAAPSCTPSRGAILTGQAPHRLENGGNLWSILPAKFRTYPDLLEAAGYAVGLTGKGWGPGTLEGTGRARNPAGPAFKDFAAFLEAVPEGRPFCYWFGSTDPHRPYEPGSGRAAGIDPAGIEVPPWLPDTPEVRDDLADYAFEVRRFDRDVARILELLDARGLADNTLVVVTSDNGMPFPRAKANLYDAGTRMPLALRWPSRIKPGRTVDAFVTLADLAPTFLEAAGLPAPPEMTGRGLLPLLGDDLDARARAAEGRARVFLERERHANVRRGDLGYPARAVRTATHLYVRNLRPDRWPAGDPEMYRAVGPYGDVDPSPTKDLILARRDDPALAPFYRLAFDKRPAEELYDLTADRGQVRNVADDPAQAATLAALRAAVDRWMAETGDPRVDPATDVFDAYPYVSGNPAAAKKKAARPR